MTATTRLGDRVKVMLKERRVSGAQLARHLGVGPHRVTNWLLGVSEPNLEYARLIATYLDVPLDGLVARTEEDFRRALAWHQSRRALMEVATRCRGMEYL